MKNWSAYQGLTLNNESRHNSHGSSLDGPSLSYKGGFKGLFWQVKSLWGILGSKILNKGNMNDLYECL